MSIVVADGIGNAVDAGVEQFAARLRELHVDDAFLTKREAWSEPSEDSGKLYLAVTPNAPLEARLSALPSVESEGYNLLVDTRSAFILGKDQAGLYYGLMTLRQLVDSQGRIARVSVSDWPDMRLRGTYMAGSAGLDARILQCAALKLNFMLFECSDFFDLEDEEILARWGKAFALCRANFIEPVPEIQSLGWGQFVLSKHPAAAEGVYVDKRRFEVKDGAVQSPDAPSAPPAAIVNAEFEDESGLTGWRSERQGDCVVIDSKSPHAGKGSLRVTQTELGTMRVFQDVSVLPHSGYELSCFIRTKGVAQGSAYIEVYGLNDDGRLGNFLVCGVPIKGDHDWERMAGTFDSGEYAKVQIYIRIQDAVGTAWFDDVAIMGTPSLNPLGNLLISDAAPLVVQDETGATTFEEGKDYRIASAPTTFPFGLGEPSRIETLADGKIKNGTAVLLSYHQAPQGSMSCCPSEPLYQEFMRGAIHSLAKTLKTKFIHIGHDEPRVINRDQRCKARNLSNSQLFADDIQRMREFAREIDPSIRLMMWSDAVNPYHNGPSLDMNDAASLIPKDVVQCPWWYDWPDNDGRIEKSTTYFLNQGFDVTGSPWFKHRNVYQWAETLHRFGKDNPHVLGMIYTSWGDTTEDPWQALKTAAEYSWNLDGTPLDEFLNRQQR
jgi:hypothetical protein